MQRIHDSIAHMKQKPEHVRRRIALGTSIGITALVAVIWGGTMISTGALALSNSGTAAAANAQPAKDTTDVSLSGTNTQSNFSQLMGAVSEATGATSSKPALKIVDGTSSSSFESTSTAPSSATSIRF